MEIMLKLEREELNSLQYPILVEMWKRVSGNKILRDSYKAEFNKSERDIILNYHHIFRQWHLVSGTPEKHIISPHELAVIRRAIDFLARI